ncbi:hypothetical protein QQP08_026501 [Theobroma cacao]|nr:hypothetical protein QQP08_026501 [Theobroma cacao]
MKVDAIDRPSGGISHTLDFTLFGIHSTKNEERYLFVASTMEQIKTDKVEKLCCKGHMAM